MSTDNIVITVNNFQVLIKEEKIKYDDLKTKLTLGQIENIYFECVIKSYFGYDKYWDLINYFKYLKN
jgi:hypothetical protein